MGNSGSTNVPTTSKCNSCSQNGLYFQFGAAKSGNTTKSYYNNHLVYLDSNGRFIRVKSKKVYLPKGARVTKTKKTSPKKSSKKSSKQRSPKKRKMKKHYPRYSVNSPLQKQVKDKNKKNIGVRLSARAVYNNMGSKAVGKSFSILQKDGKMKMKVLRLRKNGSPYFANNFGQIKQCQRNSLTHLNIPVKMLNESNKLVPRKISILPRMHNTKFGA